MNNTYLLMRHARSEANEQGIIMSDPAKAVGAYGLTDEGVQQAKRAALALFAHLKCTPIIYSSDFLRARQTADIVASRFGADVALDERLRERNFGELNGQPDTNYHKVWDTDIDPDSTAYGAESLRAMTQRMYQVVLECERNLTGQTVLLVSHGDPLVALNSFVRFGDYRPPVHAFANAEVRRIDEDKPFSGQ